LRAPDGDLLAVSTRVPCPLELKVEVKRGRDDHVRRYAGAGAAHCVRVPGIWSSLPALHQRLGRFGPFGGCLPPNVNHNLGQSIDELRRRSALRPMRSQTTGRGPAHRACVCVAALVAMAWASPATPAPPARIAIEAVNVRAAGLAVTWRAAASGRYVVWVGGTYCGGGAKAAEGRYTPPARGTVVIASRRVRPRAPIRVCLRTSSETLSDAVVAPASTGGARLNVEASPRRRQSRIWLWLLIVPEAGLLILIAKASSTSALSARLRPARSSRSPTASAS
jgi:hypothetical protein